jgi:hypothetical protein
VEGLFSLLILSTYFVTTVAKGQFMCAAVATFKRSVCFTINVTKSGYKRCYDERNNIPLRISYKAFTILLGIIIVSLLNMLFTFRSLIIFLGP